MHRLILWGQGSSGSTYSELSLLQMELRQGLPPIDLGETHQMPSMLTGSSYFQGQIAVSPDLTNIVLTSATTSGKIMVCRGGGEHSLFDVVESPLVVFNGDVEGVAASNDYFAVCGRGSSYVMLFDWATMTAQNLPVTGIGHIVYDVAFSQDGRYLAAMSSSGFYLRLYDLQEPGFPYIDVASGARPGGSSYGRLAWSEDGKLFVTSDTSSPYIAVYDTSLNRIHQVTTSAAGYTARAIINLPGKGKMAIAHWTTSASYPTVQLMDTTTYAMTTLPRLRTVDDAEIRVNNWSLAYDPVLEQLYLNHAPIAVNSANSANMSRIDLNNIAAGWETFFTGPARRDTRGIWNMLIISRDRGRITGTVRDIDNQPAERVVRAYHRQSGVLLAQTRSDPVTGHYVLLLPNLDPADVVFQAEDGELLNDLFFANAQPEPAP